MKPVRLLCSVLLEMALINGIKIKNGIIIIPGIYKS